VAGEPVMTHPAVSNGSYDVAKIRADFPALALQVYGKPLVYLDNAASAQKPKAVLDRMYKAATEQYANVHRGLHYLANEATEAYEGARETVRGFLNAGRPEEIIFTRNATEAINLVAYTFGRERIQAGDEIVLSIMEHHSNIVPWHFLREPSWSPSPRCRTLSARRCRSKRSSSSRMRAAFRCWSTARKGRCISTSTCAISIATSMS
jgi:cysteine desulfurase/selenocysteine lyase